MKHGMLGPIPSFWLSKSEWSLRICIANKFPGDADAAGLGDHTWRMTYLVQPPCFPSKETEPPSPSGKHRIWPQMQVFDSRSGTERITPWGAPVGGSICILLALPSHPNHFWDWALKSISFPASASLTIATHYSMLWCLQNLITCQQWSEFDCWKLWCSRGSANEERLLAEKREHLGGLCLKAAIHCVAIRAWS